MVRTFIAHWSVYVKNEDVTLFSLLHVTQLRRYEKGESLPTLDALRRLAIALNVPGDMLLFDDKERMPPEDFLLQFDALMQLSAEEKKIARAVLDGLVLRHQARKLMHQEQTK